MNPLTHVAQVSQMFRRRFMPATLVHVLPTPSSHVAEAARMAGMQVVFRPAAKRPFPDMVDRLSREGSPQVELVGEEESARHDAIRDDLANGIRAAPGGNNAITEVTLIAVGTLQRADADIVARAPPEPRAASNVFFEIKTGGADIRPNQQYVYALTLVGRHVRSGDSRLPDVGLTPDVPLPAMDFLFVSAQPPDWRYEFALVLAADVNQAASLEQIMAYVAAAEAAR